MCRWPSCRCPRTECGNAPCANRGHGPLPQRQAELGSRGKNNGAATNRLQAGSYATLAQIRRSPLAGDVPVAILPLPSDRVRKRAMRESRAWPAPTASSRRLAHDTNSGAATDRLQAGSYATLALIRRSPLAGNVPVAILPLPSDRVWERAMRANRGHGPLPQRLADAWLTTQITVRPPIACKQAPTRRWRRSVGARLRAMRRWPSCNVAAWPPIACTAAGCGGLSRAGCSLRYRGSR